MLEVDLEAFESAREWFAEEIWRIQHPKIAIQYCRRWNETSLADRFASTPVRYERSFQTSRIVRICNVPWRIAWHTFASQVLRGPSVLLMSEAISSALQRL
jgi:hypothetical protein